MSCCKPLREIEVGSRESVPDFSNPERSSWGPSFPQGTGRIVHGELPFLRARDRRLACVLLDSSDLQRSRTEKVGHRHPVPQAKLVQGAGPAFLCKGDFSRWVEAWSPLPGRNAGFERADIRRALLSARIVLGERANPTGTCRRSQGPLTSTRAPSVGRPGLRRGPGFDLLRPARLPGLGGRCLECRGPKGGTSRLSARGQGSLSCRGHSDLPAESSSRRRVLLGCPEQPPPPNSGKPI